MGSYVLIESRDPFDSADAVRVQQMCGWIADNALDVTVYLVQNGVMPARAGSDLAAGLTELSAKATVLADDFSLRERGIGTGELADGVGVATMEDLVDMVASGDHKVLWH